MKATRVCSVEGCGRTDVRTRGLCNLHYKRMWTSGEFKLLPTFSLAERLAAHLLEMPSGCLEWTGGTNLNGYGTIGRGGRAGGKASVHRVAWELANGPIPDGSHVLHHCDNPPCCQTEPTEGYPEGHLFLGTRSDNMADMISKGRSRGQRKTHCKHGHEFTDANTYINTSGNRTCRACGIAATSRWQKKRRLACVKAA